MRELEGTREIIGIDAFGWVPDDEQFEKSKAITKAIKTGLLIRSNTENKRIAIQKHFPFDDHDEDV
jgi:hypothetical protein